MTGARLLDLAVVVVYGLLYLRVDGIAEPPLIVGAAHAVQEVLPRHIAVQLVLRQCLPVGVPRLGGAHAARCRLGIRAPQAVRGGSVVFLHLPDLVSAQASVVVAAAGVAAGTAGASTVAPTGVVPLRHVLSGVLHRTGDGPGHAAGQVPAGTAAAAAFGGAAGGARILRYAGKTPHLYGLIARRRRDRSLAPTGGSALDPGAPAAEDSAGQRAVDDAPGFGASPVVPGTGGLVILVPIGGLDDVSVVPCHIPYLLTLSAGPSMCPCPRCRRRPACWLSGTS